MPETTILAGPPGDITREPFFDDVLARCRDPHRASALRYIVPTARRRLGVERAILGECSDGAAICLPPVLTIDRFARGLFAFCSSPRRLISWHAAALIVDQILSESPDDYPTLLARRERPLPGLVRAVLTTLRVLKRHALSSDDVARVARGDAKVQECAAFYEQYDTRLAEHGWADLQDAVLVVGRRLRDDRAFRDSAFDGVEKIILEGFVEFSPAELLIVEAMMDRVDATLVLDADPDLADVFPTLPDVRGRRARRLDVSPFVGAARIALGAPVPDTDALASRVVLVESATREDEVGRIAAEIKRLLLDGARQDDIAVAVPGIEQYGVLIEETFAAHGLPCTVARAAPLGQSPVMAAVLLLLQAVATSFERSALVGLFRSPLVRFIHDGCAIDGRVLDELARRMRIFRGRAAWLAGLESRVAHLERVSADPGQFAERDDDAGAADSTETELHLLRDVQAPLAAALDLLDTLHEPRSTGGWVSALRELITRFGIEARVEELALRDVCLAVLSRALEALLGLLDELEQVAAAGSPSRAISLDQFVETLRAAAAEMRMTPHLAPEGIEVLDLRAACDRRTKHLFFIGLVEGSVPAPPRHDALLSPGARRALGLPEADALRHDALLDVYRTLASATERLVLSRPTTDDNAPLLKPVVFERLESALGLKPTARGRLPLSRDELLCALGRRQPAVPPVDALAKDAAFSGDSALTALAHACPVERVRRDNAPGHSPHLGRLSPHVAARVAAVYDREHEYSATELETYVRCPFRFFAKWVVRLDEIDEPEEDMPPRERGTLLHRIFHEFYARRLREHGSGGIPEHLADEAREQLVQVAGQLLDEEPYAGFLWDKLRERLGAPDQEAASDVPGLFARFVDVELQTTEGPATCTPRYLEIGFGSQRHRRRLDTASREQPVAIEAGDRIVLLHGIIDRIDVNADAGTFCVLDYKSGGTIPATKQIQAGLSLQLPIYILAACDLLGEKMRFAAAGYFQTKDAAACAKKGFIGHADRAREAVHGLSSRNLLLDDADLNELLQREREAIGRAVCGIESGEFSVTEHGPDVANCRVCGYKHICRSSGIAVRTLVGAP